MIEIGDWVIYNGEEYLVVGEDEERNYEVVHRILILEPPSFGYGYGTIEVYESEIEEV